MELISREDLLKQIEIDSNGNRGQYGDEWFFIDTIKKIPTIESRAKGAWVGIDEEPHEEWECSHCGNIITTYMQDELEEHKYCHKCGAAMSTPWAEQRGEE